jgi:hypothetical protein
LIGVSLGLREGARAGAVLSPSSLALTLGGVAFGEGLYLAEDAGKADQYATVDKAHDIDSVIHNRLYSDGEGLGVCAHPGDVCYVLVCRAAMGLPIVTVDSLLYDPQRNVVAVPTGLPLTQEGSEQVAKGLLALPTRAERAQLGTRLFPHALRGNNNTSLLARVPDVNPPSLYSSVVAEIGASVLRSVQRS